MNDTSNTPPIDDVKASGAEPPLNSTLSTIFTLQSRLVMVGWFILICLPFWDFGKSIVLLVITMLSAVYAYLIFFGSRFDEGHRAPSVKGFLSLQGVMKLFKNPRATLAGWIHFLAFDLMIGLFIVMDAQQQMISHWFLVPILLFTLMIGPSGLLFYIILRLVLTGGVFV